MSGDGNTRIIKEVKDGRVISDWTVFELMIDERKRAGARAFGWMALWDILRTGSATVTNKRVVTVAPEDIEQLKRQMHAYLKKYGEEVKNFGYVFEDPLPQG